jgi:hypothetical protein
MKSNREGRDISARWALVLILAPFALLPAFAADRPIFALNPQFLTPPDGSATIGDAHGDIAISPEGEILVSVQGGKHAGLQVYSAQGRYLYNVPNAPNDLHGFVIARVPDGAPNIFGVSLEGQQILQLTLDGRVVLRIPSTEIPDKYKTFADGKYSVHLTGIAVAPRGNMYAVDGYGRDFIHQFDDKGRYLRTFGGPGEPWNFKQCHQIAIDSRFKPIRLLCTDRLHNRLVHMNLDGKVLGTVAEGLRWPSAVAVFQNELAVAELEGRVSILGLKGEMLATVGTNENADEIRTNQVPPESWRSNVFYAPHGIVYDANGNLLVTEWSKWGRVVRVIRR